MQASGDKRVIRAAVLTVSDRCSAGVAQDLSGPAVEKVLVEKLGAEVVARGCVPDEVEAIAGMMRSWVGSADLIVSTGGTGLSPRDVTPEGAMRVIERPYGSLMELARARTLAITPKTYLSRGVAGIAGRSLILTLPGSPRGACEQLEAIIELLPHAVEIIRGESGGH